ncbi:MAG: fibronectin type protein, partial [Frankiales bacterium]|nr:fibronectin type protein [Frankiales bacterium]
MFQSAAVGLRKSHWHKAAAGGVGIIIAGAGLLAFSPTAVATTSACTDGSTPASGATVSCSAAGNYTLHLPANTLSVDLDVIGGGGAGGRFTSGGNAAELTGTPTLPNGTTALYVVVGGGGLTHTNIGDIGVTGLGGAGSAVFALDSSNAVLGKVAIAGGGGGGGAFAGSGGDAGSPGIAGIGSIAGGAAVGATPGAAGTPDTSNGDSGANGTAGTTTSGTTLGTGGAGGAQPTGG